MCSAWAALCKNSEGLSGSPYREGAGFRGLLIISSVTGMRSGIELSSALYSDDWIGSVDNGRFGNNHCNRILKLFVKYSSLNCDVEGPSDYSGKDSIFRCPSRCS